MADGNPASATYRPRAPAGTALQRLVARTLPVLEGAVDALDAGASLPRFVRDALDGYAGCGDYARGMARLRCGPCRLDRFVAFTCKRRVVCASCGGRRMTDLAACDSVQVMCPRADPSLCTSTCPAYAVLIEPASSCETAYVAYQACRESATFTCTGSYAFIAGTECDATEAACDAACGTPRL